MRSANLENLNTATRGVMRLGVVIAFGFLAATILWGTQIDLPQSITVNGFVRTDAPVHVVRSPTGGTVSNVAVRAGEELHAGQPLLRFDNTKIRQELQAARRDRMAMEIEKARLAAQTSGRQTIDLSSISMNNAERAATAEIVALEQRQLDAHREAQHHDSLHLRNRITALERTLNQITRRLGFEEEQVSRSAEVVGSFESLRVGGRIRATELERVQRTYLGLQAGVAGTQADLSRLELALAAARQELEEVPLRDALEVANRVTELTRMIAARSDSILLLEQALSGAVISSPINGFAMQVNDVAVGSVIAPFEPLMEIIPARSGPVLEVNVPLKHIGKLALDMPAQVSIGAAQGTLRSELSARVSFISPDAILGPNGQPSHFMAHLRLEDTDTNQFQIVLINGEAIRPGMPISAQILGGSRTLFEYLARPLSRTFAGAFSGS